MGSTTLISSAFTALLNCAEVGRRNRILTNYRFLSHSHVKRIIIFKIGLLPIVMYNPVLKKKAQDYQAEEGCLSLDGVRQTKRYRDITVAYLDQHFQLQEITLKDFPVQVCQHELDHLEGILI